MNGLLTLIENKCKEFTSKKLIVCADGESVSYEQFYERIHARLSFWNNGLPILEHLSFSIIAPNSIAYLTNLMALLSKDFTAVNLNPRMTSKEIFKRLQLGKVSLLICTKEVFQKLEKQLAKTSIRYVYLLDEDLDQLIVLSDPHDQEMDAEDRPPSFLQFTSGTTGVVKAAEISQENVIANLDQLSLHFEKFDKNGPFTALISFPFYHIFSIVFNVLFFLKNGGKIILYPNLQDVDVIISLFAKHKVNLTVGVNTWYKKLMQHPDFKSLTWDHLEVSLAGAEYIPIQTKKEWEDLTGQRLFSAYGLTETCSLSIISPFDETDLLDSIGIPIPKTKVGLLNKNNEWIKNVGVVGEIAIKGAHLCSGYYNNPIESKGSFIGEWFKTGDLGELIAENRYKIVDRKKDMVNVSGNKVYPNEVEDVIRELDFVLDVGVVGLKSEKTGEEVVAFVVTAANKTFNESVILEHCKSSLTAFKVPKQIVLLPELPKTAIGKTSRKDLRELINQIV